MTSHSTLQPVLSLVTQRRSDGHMNRVDVVGETEAMYEPESVDPAFQCQIASADLEYLTCQQQRPTQNSQNGIIPWRNQPATQQQAGYRDSLHLEKASHSPSQGQIHNFRYMFALPAYRASISTTFEGLWSASTLGLKIHTRHPTGIPATP